MHGVQMEQISDSYFLLLLCVSILYIQSRNVIVFYDQHAVENKT